MRSEKGSNSKRTEASPRRSSVGSRVLQVIGGDVFKSAFFRRQTKLIVLLVVLTLFYIQNRYAAQRQMIELDQLRETLIHERYRAVGRNAELMERSRQSRIEDAATRQGQGLHVFTRPPYLIGSGGSRVKKQKITPEP